MSKGVWARAEGRMKQLARTRLNVPLFQRPIRPMGAEVRQWKVFMTIRSAPSFT